jgi:hypothetical protein
LIIIWLDPHFVAQMLQTCLPCSFCRLDASERYPDTQPATTSCGARLRTLHWSTVECLELLQNSLIPHLFLWIIIGNCVFQERAIVLKVAGHCVVLVDMLSHMNNDCFATHQVFCIFLLISLMWLEWCNLSFLYFVIAMVVMLWCSWSQNSLSSIIQQSSEAGSSAVLTSWASIVWKLMKTYFWSNFLLLYEFTPLHLYKLPCAFIAYARRDAIFCLSGMVELIKMMNSPNYACMGWIYLIIVR